MGENPHYKELLEVLNEFEVEYLAANKQAIGRSSDLEDLKRSMGSSKSKT